MRIAYFKLTAAALGAAAFCLALYTLRVIKDEREWRRRHEQLSASPWLSGNESFYYGLTLVTAYFNVGNFTKGVEGQRDAALYRRWLRSFKLIENPVVAYFDERRTAAYFDKLRSGKPTRTFVVSTGQLWAFTLRDRVQSVIASPRYDRVHPNTVNADYDCAMHAKYELVQAAIRGNYFRTKYVGWIDVGIYRDISSSSRPSFYIEMPSNHDESAVAFSQVEPLDPKLPLDEALTTTRFFVAGGFFVGRVDVVQRFADDYKRFVVDLLERNLTNADQSILYAMYHPSNIRRPTVSIQAYKVAGGYNAWFFLCYTLRSQWLQHSYVDADFQMYF